MIMPIVMNRTLPAQPALLLDHWNKFEPLSQTAKTVIGIFMFVILLVGAVGNTIILFLFSKYKSLRSPSNTLVMNLTAADLSMCVLCTPVILYHCVKTNPIEHSECFYYATIAALTGFVSIMSFAAIAVDRCVVIGRNFPMTHPNDKYVIYVVMFIIWLVSAVGALLPVFGLGSYVLEGSRLSCTFDYLSRTRETIIHNLVLQIVFFATPLSVIIIAYLLIFMKVRSHEKQFLDRKSGKHFDEVALRRIRKSQKLEQNELKTARSCLILVCIFCVSWLPYSVICSIALFGDTSNISPIVVTIPGLFAKATTVLNPLFYVFLNNRFKRKLKLLIKIHIRKTPSGFNDSQRRTRTQCFNYLFLGKDLTATGTRMKNNNFRDTQI